MIKPQFSNEDIKAVFSLRSFETGGEIGRKAFAKKVGFNSQNLIVPTQTHSTNVNFVSTAKVIRNCDGIFTNGKNITCSIQVADCMPIFVAHLTKNVFGLVHAGWRGLVNGILEESSKLIIENGYRLPDFEIIIGPSIQKCCFEVRDDIVQRFKSEFVIQTDENGKYKVDLQKYALSVLTDSGFEESKIKFISECTYCLKEKYHSYRRDGKNSGRMIGLIGTS
tara:strand:- start:71 stop:739 length:669 start_codon:yes stop_codon:yes gene_type:complete